MVFKTLLVHSLFAKKSKCSFGQPKLEYLGHVITAEGISTDPEKIQAMINWPRPTTIRALRGLLSLIGYYRKFVAHYGSICRPLSDLLKKDAFKWNEEAEQAFIAVKEAMSTTQVLTLPDYNQGFVVETDACYSGIYVVLMQKCKPVAYFSKVLA